MVLISFFQIKEAILLLKIYNLRAFYFMNFYYLYHFCINNLTESEYQLSPSLGPIVKSHEVIPQYHFGAEGIREDRVRPRHFVDVAVVEKFSI